MKVPPRQLTEHEWRRVFEIRCRSKRGESLSPEDIAFCTKAWKSNRRRYAAMDPDIFEATKPVGSTR